MKDLNYFRNKIRSMDFIPMTDDELQTVLKKDFDAIINARLEGIYQTKEEREFFDMMNEERLPMHLQNKIANEWIINKLAL